MASISRSREKPRRTSKQKNKKLVASNYNSVSKGKTSSWTAKQNKIFEDALAFIEEDRPDRWQQIAKLVGDKSAEEVEKHYQILLHDLANIESGVAFIPEYDCSKLHEEIVKLNT